MHDPGQAMLAAIAPIEEIAWDNSGRGRLVSVAAQRLKIVTVTHDGLPFRAVRARSLALFSSLPVDDQVTHFMRDCLLQEVIEIICQQLKVDPQKRPTVSFDPGLPCTAPTQRKIDRGFG